MSASVAVSVRPHRVTRRVDALALLVILPFAAVLLLGVAVWHSPSMVRSVLALLLMYLIIIGVSRFHAHQLAREAWENRETLSVAQTSEYLRVSSETIRTWLRDGSLYGMDYGGRTGWRIGRSDVDRFHNRTSSGGD